MSKTFKKILNSLLVVALLVSASPETRRVYADDEGLSEPTPEVAEPLPAEEAPAEDQQEEAPAEVVVETPSEPVQAPEEEKKEEIQQPVQEQPAGGDTNPADSDTNPTVTDPVNTETVGNLEDNTLQENVPVENQLPEQPVEDRAEDIEKVDEENKQSEDEPVKLMGANLLGDSGTRSAKAQITLNFNGSSYLYVDDPIVSITFNGNGTPYTQSVTYMADPGEEMTIVIAPHDDITATAASGTNGMDVFNGTDGILRLNFTPEAQEYTVGINLEQKVIPFGVGANNGGLLNLEIKYGNQTIVDEANITTMNATAFNHSDVTLTASAGTGFEFVGWYEGIWGSSGFIEGYNENVCYSTSLQYHFQMTSATGVYALFKDNRHTVTFDTLGGAPVPATQKVPDGKKVMAPAAPSREGYFFENGWRTTPEWTGTAYDFSTPVTSDLTLYAQWTAVANFYPYDLSTASSGGGQVKGGSSYTSIDEWTGGGGVTVPEGVDVTLQAQPNEGKVFVGWSTSKSANDIVSTDSSYTFEFEEKVTLYALFDVPAPTHTVTFYSDATTVYTTATVDHNQKVEVPDAPETTGKTLSAWYTSADFDEEYDFNSPVTSDLNLYARYTAHLTVDIEVGGEGGDGGTVRANGVPVPADGVDVFTDEVTVLSAEPAEDAEFVLWEGDMGVTISTEPEIELTVEQDRSVLALFYVAPNSITFESNGGTPVDKQLLDDGETGEEPADPEREGWQFAGWYDSQDYVQLHDFTQPVSGHITVYAGWKAGLTISAYDVTNNTLGGGEVTLNGLGGVWCYSTFLEDEEVELTATASPGYKYLGASLTTNADDIATTEDEVSFTYGGTPKIYFLFEQDLKTMTLHFSSLNGDDLVDPIVLQYAYTEDLTIDDVLSANDLEFYNSLFTLNGYADSSYRTSKPMSEYSSYMALYEDDISTSDKVLNDDMDIYVCYDMIVNAVSVTIEPPKCGSEVTANGGYFYETQTNPPVVSTNGENYELDTEEDLLPAAWVDGDTEEGFEGTIVAGETYTAAIWFRTKFGYQFEDVTATVIGGTFVDIEDTFSGLIAVLADVKAEHDWGEWEIVKEATKEETGLKVRKCKHCDEKQEEVIPKIAKQKCYISFDLDGGTVDGHTGVWVVEYTEGMVITLPKPEKDGAEFDYWSGSKYYAGDQYTVTGDHKFTAVWKAKPQATTGYHNPPTGIDGYEPVSAMTGKYVCFSLLALCAILFSKKRQKH